VLTDGTVYDDRCEDVLTANSGSDWFLFNRDGAGGVKDKATDVSARTSTGSMAVCNAPPGRAWQRARPGPSWQLLARSAAPRADADALAQAFALAAQWRR
jgi:hypothetical protein